MAPELRLHAGDALAFSRAVLARAGFSTEDADACAELLVEASLRGVDSHGVVALLPRFAEQARSGYGGGAAPRVAAARGVIVSVDANGASGPRAIRCAEVAASAQARKHGVGIAVVRDLGYLGALAWTVLPPARSGLIALATCNGMAFVAPHGGTHALHGTNPIAVAVPARPDPIVLDMRTNAFHMADYWHSIASGEPLPDGTLMLEDGTPVTDPGELERRGWGEVVSLPLAGAKGYGLALVVDVLTAVLAGMPVGQDVESEHEADGLAGFVLALDPRFASGSERFSAGVERLSEQVHGIEPLAPDHPVRLPGERAGQEARRRSEQGIPVDPAAWQRMLDEIDDLSVEPPQLSEGEGV